MDALEEGKEGAVCPLGNVGCWLKIGNNTGAGIPHGIGVRDVQGTGVGYGMFRVRVWVTVWDPASRRLYPPCKRGLVGFIDGL